MRSALYPHDDSCKNKALLYLLKTDKANMRQNTAAPSQNNHIHDDMIRTIASLSTSSFSRAFLQSLFLRGMIWALFCRQVPLKAEL